ncbi:cation diffusion facilitator family transporter [Bernardetia sp.]|uniref:cation diffusion facilitator family transporter n=1 Tax=Bernardetia sp. TaxID=1937974 RepID=UPI0025BCCE15|nr:cation diffusion facilitator family transporter [Bernardetia sp.]
MTHSHHQERHNHEHAPKSLENINVAFYIGIALNIIFTAIEFFYGYATNSLALLSDATHNLSDVGSLILALIGMKLAKKTATLSYTYGFKKASLLASLINSILLVFVAGGIIYEAVERFSTPSPVAGTAIIMVSGIGVVINTISAFLFFKGQEDDINVKGAFLHLLVDALVSVGVVIAGTIIYFTGFKIIDPIISCVIAIIVLISTWNLFNESIRLVLDGVPKSIKLEEIEKSLLEIDEIESVHHMHVWALSSTENAMTVHVVLKESVFEDTENIIQHWENLKLMIRHELLHHSVHHATLELDTDDSLEDEKVHL